MSKRKRKEPQKRKKRRYVDSIAASKILAIPCSDKEGFICQKCPRTSNLEWEDWEIPRHLKNHGENMNKTERKHRISGWNEKCEKSYRKNIKRPIRNPFPIDIEKKKTKKEKEEDDKRRQREYEARRED